VSDSALLTKDTQPRILSLVSWTSHVPEDGESAGACAARRSTATMGAHPGIPAWGEGTAEDNGQTWKLVHLIRHLHEITPDQIEEMKSLNPRTRAEFEQ
jgi:hypothetical protein